MRSSIDQLGEYGSKVEPTIKPVLALSQIAESVFFKAKGMISPVDGGLHVAKYCVDPGKAFHFSAFTAFTNNFTLMHAIGIGYC